MTSIADHRSGYLLGGEEGGFQVHPYLEIPISFGHLQVWLDYENSGVVDQNINVDPRFLRRLAAIRTSSRGR